MLRKITGSILFSGSIFLLILYRTKINAEIKKILIKTIKRVKADERLLFDLLFTSDENESLVNRNIAPDLYRYETWGNMNEESKEENLWKTRISLQNTPNGNVAMFYDLYRQAFAYYSDGHITYNVLNQCAMKYVRLYNCRDFFVDTMILPDSFENPFNKMKEEEETRQKVKASNKRKELNINFDNSAFVKPKPKSTKKVVTYKEELAEIIPIVYKNNFRCMGKLSGDWNILQPMKKVLAQVDDYYHVGTLAPSSKTSYSLWKSVSNK